MDALRKAEQQKQRAAQEGQQASDGLAGKLELEPLQAPPTPDAGNQAAAAPEIPPVEAGTKPGSGRLPELPTRLEDLDEQFIAHAAEAKAAPTAFLRAAPPPAREAPGPEEPPAATPSQRTQTAAKPAAQERAASGSASVASRDAARQLFEAKQPRERGNRSFAIAVGLVTLVAAVGIGGYFWWQLQPKSNFIANGTAAQPAAPPSLPVPAPAVVPAAAVPQTAVPTTTPPLPAAVAPAPTFPSAAPLAAKPARDEDEDMDATPAPRRNAKPAPAPKATPRTDTPIRITAAPQKANPLFEQAYQAFNNGELDLAQSAWQKILQSDPRNADALHGLAAIAQQRQQADRATDYYLRAIEADPKDALALSALIALKGTADPQQTESRLKNLLAEQTDSPFLNFALGNLYAGNARWADAQQAYFKAHVADPGSPDYLFNLAVSLDQLRQPRLAAQYYNQALSAAAQRPAGFDTARAAARLKALQP
jgi:Tfp pilus assembly protein PilF